MDRGEFVSWKTFSYSIQKLDSREENVSVIERGRIEEESKKRVRFQINYIIIC